MNNPSTPVSTQVKASINHAILLNSPTSSTDPRTLGTVTFISYLEIYDKQSSATLQKSILVYSMPKAQRFGVGLKYAGEPSYYVDSCFKPNSSKGVGFGFGTKRQFPEWLERNMKENPAPGAYF